MTAKDILAFQFGRADAIRTVALSSSAIWTGIVLVLLTAFARNYDQTYIPEKPFLWFFGPLLFSLVSGTWLFLITYGLCARLKMPDVDYARRPPLWRHWPGFMGFRSNASSTASRRPRRTSCCWPLFRYGGCC
jgi:hypothetical protein